MQTDDGSPGRFRVDKRSGRFVTARRAADVQGPEAGVECDPVGSHGLDEQVARQAEGLLVEEESKLEVRRPAVRQVVLKWPQPRHASQRLDELLDAAADAVEEWAREGTNKAANRFNMFELRPADAMRLAAAGEVDGPPDADGVRRTKTGWRRVRPPDKDA